LRLYWFPRLRSTSDHAAALRKRGNLFAPAIVLTGHQIAGRGRGGNTWWSNAGVLTATFVFPIDERLAPHQLPLLAGLAVRDAVARLVPKAHIQLKWPNDLLANGLKLAGLLCERLHKADLIGVGLDVNLDPARAPKALRNSLTSLSALAGRALDMTDTLIALSKSLHAMLTHQNEQTFGQLLRQYDEHHALIGRRVAVSNGSGEPPIVGKCEGLDAMGRLLLRNRRNLHHVIAGEVRIM
jgi:BirA family biotin operon repressor/biotin-[acetyl-CoA-carboxylase] ligase